MVVVSGSQASQLRKQRFNIVCTRFVGLFRILQFWVCMLLGVLEVVTEAGVARQFDGGKPRVFVPSFAVSGQKARHIIRVAEGSPHLLGS